MKNVEGGFTRLASFVCDCEPFSEEDLKAIDASLSNATNKRPRSNDHPPRRRLPTSLVALQHPNASSLSPHPGYSRMRLPVLKFSGQIMYSRTFDAVEKAAAKLLQILEERKREMMQIVIGFDIEWKPTFKKGVPPGKVAVMQICGDTSHCHVLHLIHSGIPQNLQLLLEDPTVLKVGAGIDGDAVKVFKDYNISVKGVMDLSFHANQKLGGDQKWGLASLAEKLLSKQLKKPKKIRLGNWETPILSQGQLEYAATDAFASWYLYQAIKDLPDPDAQEVTNRSGEVDGVPQE
uniref:3'-5' exonuclease n=2 Tax=Cajanus cajan TaxID=3821 RepID=A0A151SQB5_CAJCA|nr:Werner syndrome ATP-dependent helicase isogeny [Cajanus cajan]